MPELPEVETVRRGLAKLIIGKSIKQVKTLSDKSLLIDANAINNIVVNAKVKSVRRRAKLLIIDLTSGYSLLIHLKMTGQLVYRGETSWGGGHPNDSFLLKLPDRSTRVEFTFSDDSKLFFNDQRRFGWIKLTKTAKLHEEPFIEKLGPEPLEGNPLDRFLKNLKRHPNTSIKSAILNQSVIAGVGNIYADESLWQAKIHPETKVKNVSKKDLTNLLRAIQSTMTDSIKAGGSTMKNYIKADSSKGNYLDKFAKVFRREGKVCARCGAVIIKIRVAGRGTHLCPSCQKLN